MIRHPIEVFANYTAALGDTFIFHFGGVKKVIVSSNPVFLQHVLKGNYENYQKSEIQMKRMHHFLGNGLLTSHGSYWLRQRRLIQQGFRRDHLADLAATMHDAIDGGTERFEQEIQKGPIDICPHMMRLTFGMVTRSLFSTKLKDEDIDLISTAISTIQEFMVRQIVQPYFNPWFALTGELRRHNEMRAQGDDIILNYIRHRRTDAGEHHDLLQILLDARYEDTGQGLTDEQVLSESMQLLVAAHETSSNVLSWTLYLLCKHPECIDRIRNELNSALGDARPRYSDIINLEFTTQVLEEALRLYPPFWMVDRISLADDEVMDVSIPKGSTVIAFIYGVHHAPVYWDDPERFIPERFSKENRKKQTAFTYLPFGGGPRGCIGSNYAMLQMLMVISFLVRAYEFELVPSQEIEARPMIILRPKNGIRMTFTRRGRR